MTSLYEEYAKPKAMTAFSAEDFDRFTFGQAADTQYSQIAPQGSFSRWVWAEDIPASTPATVITLDEVIPNPIDLQDILKGMVLAFDDGMRSVIVTFTVSGKEYGYQYNFSKVSH